MRSKQFGPLTIRIDRPKGTVKEWPQPDGSVRRWTYVTDYGFLPRHTGEDDEGLDFFVGDDPQGHLESFQKLKHDDQKGWVLDETKFLVGVTDAERETIYALYGPEVWHRKTYTDMDDLQQDLPKFAPGKKERYGVQKLAELPEIPAILAAQGKYASLEKDAISLPGIAAALKRPFQALRGTVPTPMPLQNVMPHRVPTMMPLRNPAPHRSAVPPSAIPQDLPQQLEEYAHRQLARGGGSAVDLMSARARELGYHNVGKARDTQEYREAMGHLGFSPEQTFLPSTERGAAMMLGNWRARQDRATPVMRGAKLGALSFYGLGPKHAGLKFSDIDKRISGEIALVGNDPAQWLFGREGQVAMPGGVREKDAGVGDWLMGRAGNALSFAFPHALPGITGAVALASNRIPVSDRVAGALGGLSATGLMGYGAYRGAKDLYDHFKRPAEPVGSPEAPRV